MGQPNPWSCLVRIFNSTTTQIHFVSKLYTEKPWLRFELKTTNDHFRRVVCTQSRQQQSSQRSSIGTCDVFVAPAGFGDNGTDVVVCVELSAVDGGGGSCRNAPVAPDAACQPPARLPAAAAAAAAVTAAAAAGARSARAASKTGSTASHVHTYLLHRQVCHDRRRCRVTANLEFFLFGCWQWRTQRFNPPMNIGFFLNVCLHKNTVQALFLYSLNPKFCTEKSLKKCTLISLFASAFVGLHPILPDSIPFLDYFRSSPVNSFHCKVLGTPIVVGRVLEVLVALRVHFRILNLYLIVLLIMCLFAMCHEMNVQRNTSICNEPFCASYHGVPGVIALHSVHNFLENPPAKLSLHID